ncbi:ribosome maturation factor RimM [Eubacterium maltosivorans]|uniref:Ribosome maturation factor RimM n=1 Tax=Eubacterium maltosivorans TaxID=2041044 RepID=A0A4P9CCV9_EUBML|nr:ribosome maturation factor RimM [Eubacterium maltosivorans]QCT73534.1 16S rRNA processing protein RimM [Eubacterium maltosivorans]
MMKKETMVIGKILGAHGIRGELKVYPLTDDPGRFYGLDAVYLQDDKKRERREVELVRLHKGNVLLTLKDVNDRNQSEKLIGRTIAIDREDAVALEADEYFIEDMIGLEVSDPDGAPIGVVKDVIQTAGSVDNIEIKTPEKLVYVPARKIYFLKVDLEAGRITADIPEELMNL